MPQHQRTGPMWTLRRLRRRMEIEARIRRDSRASQSRPEAKQALVAGDGNDRRASESDHDDPAITTVDATLKPGPGSLYRQIRYGPGEPHIVRDEIGLSVERDRAQHRTSLLYFAHHTDVHLIDAQSPSRLEVGERLAWISPGTDAGHRPQEHATVQVFDQMVRATNSVVISPVSGAAMDFAICTGDNTDNRQFAELRWFIDTLDGQVVTPNTGGPDYEGAQAMAEFSWVYHPDDPSRDMYGRYGFPRVPGLLASAVKPFQTAGSKVPWLVVLGNHDMTWQGTFGNLGRLRLGDVGDAMTLSGAKPTRLWALGASIAHELAGESDGSRAGRVAGRLAERGSVEVTPDPTARRPMSIADQIGEYFNSAESPGPVGHGFTESNLLNGTAHWSRLHGSQFMFIGLDTNNHVSGSEGRIGPRQFAWIKAELARAERDSRVVIIFSHHNSLTMSNTVDDHDDPGRATSGEELVDLFRSSPSVILWVNGHDHENRIQFHRPPSNGSKSTSDGFWEICTASCIDFGQQSRTLEVLDNGDSTLSIFSTVLDHAAPLSVAPRTDGCYTPAEIASFSREFASNDARWIDPWEQRGNEGDRNVELLVRDPRGRPSR